LVFGDGSQKPAYLCFFGLYLRFQMFEYTFEAIHICFSKIDEGRHILLVLERRA
jgi:hypothetical protein